MVPVTAAVAGPTTLTRPSSVGAAQGLRESTSDAKAITLSE
jgi:hypothetical protein